MGRAAPSSQLRLGVALIAALLLASCGSHREGVEPARLPPEVCLARLDALHVSYEKSASPEGPCPIYDPIRLRAADIPLSRPALMGCDLALAIDRFDREVVAPAARRYFNVTVKSVRHFGTYSCRGRPGGEWSEHAKGNAIDIAGFLLDDGTSISVEHDWGGSGKKRDFIHAVARGACDVFQMVLTPNSNRDHYNHLHLDIGPYKRCDA
jgi:hypothetical protein